jgi:hypothetical protein
MKTLEPRPGPVTLFGSGETSLTGQRVFAGLFERLPARPRVDILETPAGFEPNSPQVAARIADFLALRLQNYQPQARVLPARQRGTPFSPDDPQLVQSLLEADLIFMGPGSPTYTARQLRDSLAWNYLQARQRLGGSVVLASAAVAAAGAYALPVYEIYKAGADLHWQPGLDFFGAYGLALVIIPHWNNSDGGAELDTSRCYMGQARFQQLMELLPPGFTVVGIEENTALTLDFQAGEGQVSGLGGVVLLHIGQLHPGASSELELRGTGLAEVAAGRRSHVHRFENWQAFALARLGPFRLPVAGEGLPATAWERAMEAQIGTRRAAASPPKARFGLGDDLPPQVRALLVEREAARARQDWLAADALRARLAELGWTVLDTSQGVQVERKL